MTTVVLPKPVPDPLGKALHGLRMDAVFYCHSELTGPWSLAMPAIPDAVSFHVVTSGEAWVIAGEGPATHLRAGSLVLVPHGLGHLIADRPDATRGEKVEELPQDYLSPTFSVLRHGGGQAPPATLICGIVSVDGATSRRLLDLLPAVIGINGGGLDAPAWLADTLRMMAAELAQLRPGGETVTTRLADILVIQAIRSWVAEVAERGDGWFGALTDAQIGPVLAEIHESPGHDWTLPSLAAVAAMSRSGFASRFSDLVGQTPMQYVTEHRMHVAIERLQADNVTVARLAGELGYQSVAAFSRAFKRVVGHPPAHARRT